MIRYMTIDLRTVAGIKKAERLQAQGWTATSFGIDTVRMWKKFESWE